MIKFLDTEDTSHYLRNLIRNAEEFVTLVSPYIKLTEKIVEEIEEKQINVTLIYGKSDLSVAEYNKVTKCKELSVLFCEDLHAKCYISEKEAIITSMNLHQYSQENNFEMGVYFDKKERELYDKTHNEIVKIVKHSKIIKFSQNLRGYCIRTGKEIPFNPEKPFCYEAYQEWAEWENVNYKENYCHATGKKSFGKTSFAKPIL